METITSQILHVLLMVVFSILAWLLNQIRRRLNQQEHTRVKANLCFEDLVERKPEMKRHYDAVMSRNGS